MCLEKINALILLCLTLLLSSCSSRHTVKTVYAYPPQAYLVVCEKSTFTGSTYGDALSYLVKVKAERDICASQIDGIREWLRQTKQLQ